MSKPFQSHLNTKIGPLRILVLPNFKEIQQSGFVFDSKPQKVHKLKRSVKIAIEFLQPNPSVLYKKP